MSILVLGGTGFIGTPTVKALAAAGHAAIPASRRGGGPDGVELHRHDLDGLRRLVRERGVTTVVDFLAYTLVDTEQVLEALDGLVERYVLVSSGDVYRNYEGLNRRAGPAPIEAPLDEASPLRTTRYPYRQFFLRSNEDPSRWLDDYDKIPIEQALAARPGLGGVVLRLPMVYGPGERLGRFRAIIEPLEASKTVQADPSWARWRTTYGYVADVASAIALAAVHTDARGRTFNLGEADPPDHEAWIARFAEALRLTVKIEPVPYARGDARAALNYSYPLVMDTRAIRQTLGWSEPTPLGVALMATIETERAREV